MPIYIYFELMSFLASITLFFQKETPRYMKSFPVFLLLTVIVEIVASKLNNRQANIWLYNFYIIINFVFYLYILRNFIHSLKARKIILYCIVTYSILALANILFGQNHEFNSITFALGCLLVVSACIYYFFELFRRPQSVNLPREHAFWITSGLLFFYCCTFAHFSLMNFLFKGSPTILQNLREVLKIILFLFYLLITIAFLCRIRVRKSGYSTRPS
jgi:hypothetical protein